MMEEKVMVVGMDETHHSQYAFQWIIQQFFSNPNSFHAIKLVLVHAKPSPKSAFSLFGTGASDVMPQVDPELKKVAERVIEKAKEICKTNKIENVQFEVMEGKASRVLCDAVERHKADILVVGSHGHGIFKRAMLGSVTDYCSHHAQCCVMIVKDPRSHRC